MQELAGVAAAQPPQATDGDLALAHELFAVLATIGDEGPTLIAIDDLHWSDAASLEFVLYLLGRSTSWRWRLC